MFGTLCSQSRRRVQSLVGEQKDPACCSMWQKKKNCKEKQGRTVIAQGTKGAAKIDGRGLFLDLGNGCKVICFIIYEVIFYVGFLLCFTKKKVVGERDTCDQWGSYHLSRKRLLVGKDSQHNRKISRRLEEALHRRENPNSQ